MRRSCGIRPLVLVLVTGLAFPSNLPAQARQAHGVAGEQDGRLQEAPDAYMSDVQALPASAAPAEELVLREQSPVRATTALQYRQERPRQPAAVVAESQSILASPSSSYAQAGSGLSSATKWMLWGVGLGIMAGGLGIFLSCMEEGRDEDCPDSTYAISGVMIGGGLGMVVASLSVVPGGIAVRGRLPISWR